MKKYPELMKKYFGTIIPPSDNKFAALNTAVWSGGSFIYIPKGVKLKMPLQAYFRINSEKAGQFERTLIIADEGADVTYIEGCFVKGTEVVTEEGSKPIEDVKANDKVLTHNTIYKKVYHTQVRPYSGELYTIQYYGDTTKSITVTDEHPFLASKKEKEDYTNVIWSTDWVMTKELKKGDYLAVPIDRNMVSEEFRDFDIKAKPGSKQHESRLTIKTDKDFFRLIGYYLSEGSIINDSYLAFTFNKNETEYIRDTVELIERYFGKKPIVQNEYKNGISIVLCSVSAARFFRDQFSKGAKNKNIPRWVALESVDKQKELIKRNLERRR